MTEYSHIDSIFKRDMSKPTKPFIVGDYADPVFEYLKDNKWEFTEKIDGTNIRIMLHENSITFGGKTDNAQIPSHLVTRLQELFLPIERKQLLQSVFGEAWENICLYGEGFGWKIQGKVGVDYLTDKVDFYLFDVKIGNFWLRRDDVYGIGQKLGLLTAHVVGYGTLNEAIEIVKSKPKSFYGQAQSEGLVLRPCADIQNRNGSRIITKVKVRDFERE